MYIIYFMSLVALFILLIAVGITFLFSAFLSAILSLFIGWAGLYVGIGLFLVSSYFIVRYIWNYHNGYYR